MIPNPKKSKTDLPTHGAAPGASRTVESAGFATDPHVRPGEAFMAEQAAMVAPRRAALARMALAPEHRAHLPKPVGADESPDAPKTAASIPARAHADGHADLAEADEAADAPGRAPGVELDREDERPAPPEYDVPHLPLLGEKKPQAAAGPRAEPEA